MKILAMILAILTISVAGFAKGSALDLTGATQYRELPVAREVERQLDAAWIKLVSENKIAFYSLEDRRIRQKHYCKDECSCVATEFRQILAKNFSNSRVFDVYIQGEFGVTIVTAKNHFKNFFMYHRALIISGKNGEVAVFDPIVMEDAKIHSFNEWITNFEQNELEAKYYLIK